MAIDYVVDYPCAVKEELTTDGLVSMMKERGRATTLLEMLQQDGMTRDEALQKEITVQLMTTEGVVEQKKVLVQEMMARAEPLNSLSQHCSTCKAARGRTFGCCDVVNYPLSETGEQWLSSIINETLKKGLPHSMALEFIVKEKISGIPFAQMRRDKRKTFFSLAEAAEFTFAAGECAECKFDMNQVMEVIFGPPVIERPHQISLLFLSPGLTIGDEKPADGSFQQACALSASSESEVQWWSFNLQRSSGDDNTIAGLKRFFHSLFCAFSLDVPLRVSY